jgi:glycosyltransferase involved in cell wall biosynthesis
MRRGWAPRRRDIVRCGVDVDYFARSAPLRTPPARLLFAGRVESRKGLHVAIRALAASDPEVTLTVAGPVDDASYLEGVRALGAELGVADRVEWAGEVPRARIRELLSAHDVLVFPSTGVEAYALGLLEALAAGVLVVTSAVGGPREYLRHEVNALLHKPGDVAGLAQALARLRADEALVGQLLDGARQTANDISLSTVLDQVEALLEAEA